MAITNISTGFQNFHPAYNPVVYIFDSDNKTEAGFRYLVDVYPAGSSDKVGSFRIAPRPNDGYGYIDLSKFLQTLMSQDFYPNEPWNAIGSKEAPNSYFKYDVKIGEEYIQEWSFADSTYVATNMTLLGPIGGTAGSGPTHSFVPGDQIVVTLDDPTLFPTLPGLQGIVATPTTSSVLLDIPFTSSPANPGTARFADNRTTKFPDLLTISDRVAFNGAIKWNQWPSYSPFTFRLTSGSTTNRLLTNIPTRFHASLTQDLWFNLNSAEILTNGRVYFQNSLGNLYYKDFTLSTSYYVHQISAGPNNFGSLTQVSGATAPLLQGAEWYEFWIATQVPEQLTRKYRIILDRRCPIESYEILFLDRLGSLASYSFYNRSRETGTITRTTFNQQIGDLTIANRWGYSVQDRGEVISEISATKQFNLNTQWMTYEQNFYFEELLTSPFTYIKIAGVYQPCIVQENVYEVQSSTYKKLISRSVTVKIANENVINA